MPFLEIGVPKLLLPGGLAVVVGAAAAAGVSFVDAEFATTTSPAVGTIAVPAGAADGDLAVLLCGSNDDDFDETQLAPAGWSQLGSTNTYAGTCESLIATRTVTSGDLGGTWDVPGSFYYNEAHHIVAVFHSGAGTPVVDAVTPFSDYPGTDPTTTHTFPAVTTTVADTLLVLMTQTRPAGTAWTSPPGDATAIQAFVGSLTAMWAGIAPQAAIGSSGTRTIVHDLAYSKFTSWTLAIAAP